jgi:hypothetical protein
MNPLAWLEADMARHMLVEFPLLVALGALLASPRIDIDRFDRYGLTGWTLASLVLAFWMIPAALDAALASPGVNSAKYASLVAAGFALRGAMRRSPLVLEAFFVGNFAWMAATVGLVYQEAETQLCLNYLADSQQRAGRGLVLCAVAALVGFALRFARAGAPPWRAPAASSGTTWQSRGRPAPAPRRSPECR